MIDLWVALESKSDLGNLPTFYFFEMEASHKSDDATKNSSIILSGNDCLGRMERGTS
jgi:hypothetical protein